MRKKTITLFLLLSIIILISLFVAFYVHIAMVGELSWPPFQHPRGRLSGTGISIRACCMDILYFHDKMGRYPNDLKELKDWIGIKDTNDTRMFIFFDGWKHSLKYEVKNPKLNVGKFDLYSVGKNSVDEYDKPDFGDDIHVKPDGGIRWPPQKR